MSGRIILFVPPRLPVMKSTLFFSALELCLHLLKRFTTNGPLVAFGVLTIFTAPQLLAQQATVDITPGHSTNSYSPLRALGSSVDRDPLNSTQILYDPTNV